MEINKIYNEDCFEGMQNLPDNSIDCCVTSPPYFGLRDYGHEGQIGLEETPELYVQKMVSVFGEVKRVLKKEGTLWLNLGDSYMSAKGVDCPPQTIGGQRGMPSGFVPPNRKKQYGLKNKDLIGVPWLVAFALRDSGYYLRQDIIWSKQNCMPESVTDRCTKSHEYVFLFSKSAKYFFDNESIKTVTIGNEHDKHTRVSRKRFPTALINGIRKEGFYPMANKRSVWETTLVPYNEAHFATFPEQLITDMIKAGCPEDGIVLDPFMGAGTTALVASKLNRNYIGFELNADYIKIANKRLQDELGMFNKAV